MKSNTRFVFLTAIIVLLLGGAYALGLKNASSRTDDIPRTYATSLDSLRRERDQALNDYTSACDNYQTLYESYDVLYEKTGATSGLQKTARVDGARGNEDSCYR